VEHFFSGRVGAHSLDGPRLQGPRRAWADWWRVD
jgi:hypothetical protein